MGEVRDAVEAALDLLDRGEARVAEKIDGKWVVNQWLKKAVLLSFRLNDMATIPGAPGGASWFDKVPSKFAGWDDARFRAAGFRAVPGCVRGARPTSRRARSWMPSFVNPAPTSARGRWSIPGAPSAVARRSAATSTWAASVSAAC